MKHIKKIELVFENCEYIEVSNAIGDFYIGEITKEVTRIASNSIATFNDANLIYFQVYGNGEIKSHLWDNINPIDRLLKYNDITSIDITYIDDTVESFYPKYEGDEFNANQTMKKYKDDVFVVISPNKTVDDIYTEEIMDNLIDSKDFCMKEDVTALNNLKANHWIVLYQNDNYIQLLNDEVANIIITKDDTNILFKNSNNENYIIPNKVMYDICSLIFNLCFLKNSLSKEDIKEYEHLNIIEKSTFDNEAEGIIDVKFKFYLKHDTIYSTLEFDRDKDNFNDKLLKGKLTIDKYDLPIEDVYNLMWILHTYLPDEFWR